LLRRALRDSDPRVVESAAQAIEPFRSTPHRTVVQAARPPRNVSRMR
jgi:phosphoribosylcarboxyaminoimidazole (NCAIR) mutase